MKKSKTFSRRDFLSASTLAASSASFSFLPATHSAPHVNVTNPVHNPANDIDPDKVLDLSPAHWIWYPARRILANSFFHFRKEYDVRKGIRAASGWIVGESRYVLFCNGKRIQFGPAPCDPRFTEADPVDLTTALIEGKNVIGATVLYYGYGDGVWPAGKAGFIFKLVIEYNDDTNETLISDNTWKCQLARSWSPGMYKRWYLRSLQESFDNRLYPHGWNTIDFAMDESWRSPAPIGGSADKTALSTSLPDYMFDSGSPVVSQLRRRSVPLIKENEIPAVKFVEAHYLRWNTSPYEYFDLLTADAYAADGEQAIVTQQEHGWHVKPSAEKGLVMTFEMSEQVVGWPFLSIEAGTGTTIELMVQQGHRPFNEGGPPLTNENLNSWTRFVCKEGYNDFMCFDYESVKWIQLHIHETAKAVTVREVGVLRRTYDFAFTPMIKCSDKRLQKLFDASFNTMRNNCHDTIVDCMGRERQQYSGDIGHVVHMLHSAYGERRLPSRYINTFSQGMTSDGYFMDSWPAYDRLNRIGQRQLGLTPWGPLLDHSVGFNYDVWYHFLYSGAASDLKEVFPRLVRFFQYLKSKRGSSDLFEVENLGVPAVWMDTDSYKEQRHKQCAYNLYVAAMLKDAFAPLCDVFEQPSMKDQALDMSIELVKGVRRAFWSEADGILINNLPWYKSEGDARTCERSLAHYLLGGFASGPARENIVREFTELPARFGVCYPPNAQWRYWTLAATGNIQPVIDELRSKWSVLPSVIQNNTLPEQWRVVPDQHAQYSHAAIAPIYVAYMCIAGITILEPGAGKIKVYPQPGDIPAFLIRNFTAKGPIDLQWEGKKGKRRFQVTIPAGVSSELWLDHREKVSLPLLRREGSLNVFRLGGGVWKSTLAHT